MRKNNQKSRKRINRVPKTFVIVHGKSERIFCEAVGRALRIPVKIISSNNGTSSIQIQGLEKLFCTRKDLKTLSGFRQKYFHDQNILNRQIQCSVRIFVMMDVDDCPENYKYRYKNQEILQNHWSSQILTLIFNDPNFEKPMEEIQLPFKNQGDRRKKEYDELFMSEKTFNDYDSLLSFRNKIKGLNCTNMELFLDHCLERYRELNSMNC